MAPADPHGDAPPSPSPHPKPSPNPNAKPDAARKRGGKQRAEQPPPGYRISRKKRPPAAEGASSSTPSVVIDLVDLDGASQLQRELDAKCREFAAEHGSPLRGSSPPQVHPNP